MRCTVWRLKVESDDSYVDAQQCLLATNDHWDPSLSTILLPEV